MRESTFASEPLPTWDALVDELKRRQVMNGSLRLCGMGRDLHAIPFDGATVEDMVELTNRARRTFTGHKSISFETKIGGRAIMNIAFA